MLRYCMLFLAVVCLITFAVSGISQERTVAPIDKTGDKTGDKTNVQVLMRDKLTHMQKVLDGLVTDDFAVVAKEAQMLRIIGQAASWQTIDTVDYRTHSARYAQLTQKLTQAAMSKNRDAALLQYLQLNISCVDCHQTLREQKQ